MTRILIVTTLFASTTALAQDAQTHPDHKAEIHSPTDGIQDDTRTLDVAPPTILYAFTEDASYMQGCLG